MPAPVVERTMLESSAIGVSDFRCPGRDGEGNLEIVDGTQLCLVRTGVFAYRARGREYVADASSVLLLREGVEYQTRHPDGEPDSCTVFSIPEPSLRAMTGAPDDSSAIPDVPWTVRTVDPALFREHWLLLRELTDESSDPDRLLSAEERAFQIASDLLASPLPKGPPRPMRAATKRVHHELVECVKELVALRLSDRIPLAELASEVGWSPFELSRVFRRQTGIPIHRYRRQLRLRVTIATAAPTPNASTIAIGRLIRSAWTIAAVAASTTAPPTRPRSPARGGRRDRKSLPREARQPAPGYPRKIRGGPGRCCYR